MPQSTEHKMTKNSRLPSFHLPLQGIQKINNAQFDMSRHGTLRIESQTTNLQQVESPERTTRPSKPRMEKTGSMSTIGMPGEEPPSQLRKVSGEGD
jgi:hypothetical protein